jgi:predicted ribosome quality control (RQC) complex YloA/Tae2 family protein
LQSEREKYKETLRKQADDINKIKNEINLYKRKGGHIYTKVTTNRKVASLNDN